MAVELRMRSNTTLSFLRRAIELGANVMTYIAEVE